MYGKDAIVSQGQVAEIRQKLSQEQSDQIRQDTLARARATAGGPAEQIEPLIADLDGMATVINTQVDFGPRLYEGVKMWAYGLAQQGPYDVEIDGEMVNIGVLVHDYVGAAKSFLGTLARVFGGERGVLTQQDIERIAHAIPGLFTSKGNTERKMKRLRKQMQDIMRRAGIAASDPNYVNPKFVDNTEAGIRKILRETNTKEWVKGAASSIKSLAEGL